MENTGGAPTQAVAQGGTEAGQPDFQNMTGAQAREWFESQKQKTGEKSPPNKNQKMLEGKDPYLADAPRQQSSAESIKEAAAEAKRRLKIDDQEVDEDEVIKVFKERKGHQQAANKALQEGKAFRKQAEEFVAMLRDPEKFWEVAQKLGHDPRNLSEKQLVRVLEEEMMDPRDRELRDMKAKLKNIEDLELKQKETVEQERIRVLKDKFAQDYTKQFTEALQQTDLPPTKAMVAEMAKYIARSAQMGFKMTAVEAAQLVKEDQAIALRKLLGETDGEMLIKLLGENVANKIRKWDTTRLKDPTPPRVMPENQGERRERKTPHKRMSPKEWREFNRR